MVYADTGFFISLMDEKNALHKDAEKNYNNIYKNQINTSILTLAELLVGCEKHGQDPETIVGSLFQISDVAGITLEEAMRAAHYMKAKRMKAIDALHCGLAGNEIISSDKDMNKTGIKRIW